MKIVQIVSGKFHHFHLARYLHGCGELEAIFTGYPWFKLRDEGLPREIVKPFPWFAASYMAACRTPGLLRVPGLRRQWEWLTQTRIALYAEKRAPACDAVVALSGTGLEAGRRIQRNGGKYVCDRGSSHIRFQDRILTEEYERWGFRWRGIDPRIVEREESEYAQADAISVPSTFNIDSFLACGVPRERMRLVSYGANIHRFQPVCTPDSNRFIVLFVGQLSLRKGLPYLIQAFEQVRHPRKQLWLVGSPSAEVAQFLKQRSGNAILLKGAVRQTELPTLYSQAHAFVLPSIEEGLAMVQGEALACGCPVISTTNSGAADLFTDGKEGFIVPIRDADAIAERLTRLADDPRLRAEMSHAALERVRRLGGWDEYGRNYRSMLATLTGAAVIEAKQTTVPPVPSQPVAPNSQGKLS